MKQKIKIKHLDPDIVSRRQYPFLKSYIHPMWRTPHIGNH